MMVTEKTSVNLANGLSLLRMLLAPLFFLLFLQGRYVPSFLVILVATLTDALDGQVARAWNMQTRLGKMLDPAADKLIMFFAVLALILKAGFPLWIGVLIVLRDLLLLVGGSVFLYRNRKKVLVPNKVGKATTFVQMSTIVIFLLNISPSVKQVFLWATVLMTLFSFMVYAVKGHSLLFGEGGEGRGAGKKEERKIRNLANKITLLRIVFIPAFIWILMSSFPYQTFVAASVFVLLALSDAVDGYIARKRREITSVGKLIDPLADKLLVTAALIFLIGKGVDAWMAYTIIAREFLITGIRTLYLLKDEVLAARMSGKVKTVAQIVAIVAVLLRLPFGKEFMLIATLITLSSGVEYFWGARKLFRD